jgi:hypothetical protein
LFVLTAIVSEVALFIGAALQPDERMAPAIVGGLALAALWMCCSGFMPAEPDDAPDEHAALDHAGRRGILKPKQRKRR